MKNKLYVETLGDHTRPACVLISGAMASCKFWTDHFCNQLADAGFFVIRYDHRDMGGSPRFDWGLSPYTLEDLAGDVVAILDHYQISKAHLVGHSMGGYIAQVCALKFATRVLSLCIISAGPVGATAETDLPLSPKEQAIQNGTWKIMLARQGEELESYLPIWKHLNGQIPLDEQIAVGYTQDLLGRSKDALRAGNNHELVMRSLDLETLRGQIETIDLPTLIIHGDCDPLVLPRQAKALAHAISEAKLMMLAQMGHLFFNQALEEKIATIIINHLKQASSL